MSQLQNKVIFITGGTSGIGKAVTKLALAQGAKVASLSMNPERIEAAKAEFKGDNVLFFQGDVSDEHVVQNAFNEVVKTFGTVDILLNNAGLGLPTTDLATTDLETYDKMFHANSRGVFLCSREALKIMKPKKCGQILTVISMAGQRANPVAPLYCASKFAARGFTQGLSEQAVKDGIRVTDINPGPVDTNYWGDRTVPREKMLKPEDVAEVILFTLNAPKHVVMHEINFDALAWLAK